MIYFWLSVVVLAIVAEAITADLIAVWIIPSALISMILAIIDVPLWVQIVVFLVLVAALLVLSKTILRKYLQKRPAEITNAESLLGQTAIVTEALNNLSQSGAVRVNGLEWSARSVSDETVIEKGSLVVIREIRGVKLICEENNHK